MKSYKNINSLPDQKLLKISSLYANVIDKLFDNIETKALNLTHTREGVKYIKSASFKLELRNLKTEVLKNLKFSK